MSPGDILDESMIESIKGLEGTWEDADPEEFSHIKKEIEMTKYLKRDFYHFCSMQSLT